MKQALAIPTPKQNFTPCARGKEVKPIDIRHPFIRDLVQNYSLLPAITVDGLIFTHVKIGGYTDEQFVDRLEGLLEVMNPYPAL
ncbi:hypothetical protein B0H13DRAFT_2300620 [Mycena leptocephala]|nr:hypothetical protein B0H13DRAFT_2300620 [Mycena leptocephala]